MTNYRLNSVGMAGHVWLYDGTRTLDDNPHYSIAQKGSALQATTPTTLDGTGTTVSMDIIYSAIGVPGQSKVDIYNLVSGTWTYLTTLTANTLPGDLFGYSVSISDNTIAVGAPGANGGAGIVYLFEEIGNVFRPSTPPVLQANDIDVESSAAFGSTVLLTNNTLIVGAPMAFGGSGTTERWGAVYGFTYKNFIRNWVTHARITAPIGQDGSKFGSVLSLENEAYLAVGAPNITLNYGVTVNGAGAVYLYIINQDVSHNYSWNYLTRIIHPTGVANGAFGNSISFQRNQILIGCPNEDAGSAYLFIGFTDVWALNETFQIRTSGTLLTDPTVTATDQQGWCVDQDENNHILIGSPSNNGNGAIYIFEKTQAGNWKPSVSSKIIASDVSAGDQFSKSFQASAGNVIAGSPGRNNGGVFYFFG